MGDQQIVHTVNIGIPFSTPRLAQIAYEVLRVDTEPKRSKVKKDLSRKENILNATFSAELARQLRVAVNSFFENVILITQTFECAGPPVSDSYSHYC